ncbi:hypothetical protein KAR91_08175 [Candidatus Pacearchaeota archaeon]|nr:hypothetical protein [Candidatus Pacearchaeota archaeon]
MKKQIPEIIGNGLYVDPMQKGLGYNQEKERKPTKENVEVCRRCIREWIDERRTINKNHNSYGLKHFVEIIYEGYISNGAFIQAALDEGYRIIPDGSNSPNAYFNMSFVRIEREVKRRKDERYDNSKETGQ